MTEAAQNWAHVLPDGTDEEFPLRAKNGAARKARGSEHRLAYCAGTSVGVFLRTLAPDHSSAKTLSRLLTST
jgi:hypothetical protein